MSNYMLWLIVAFVLVIVEVMTGTFYLLVLGVAAFAGALAAFLGAGAFAQAAWAGIVAILGLVAVNRWHKSRPAASQKDQSLDVGQIVTLESWLDQNVKRVRVKYRDTAWDAQIVGDANVQIGDSLFICSAQGNILEVSRSHPTQ